MTVILLWCVYSSVEQACNTADEVEAVLEQARIAAALAVHRAERGAYPEELDKLVPGIIQSLPSDPYSETGFRYFQKPDGGYLLYGVYENGIDDGGTSLREEIVKGEWVTTEQDIADDSYDLVIRVPVPEIVTAPETVDFSNLTRY